MPRHLIRSLLFLVVPTAGLAAQAQPDTTRLPDLEVTATRLVTRSQAVTAAVTVLPGDALRAKGVRFVLDALREVPGAAVVQTGSYGGQTSLFLRGGESDYVKVLVDGVPVNLSGGGFNFAHLTTDDVERIEVVRGPVGVVYGADAVSGVVNVITRRTGPRGAAAFERGTFGTARWHASAAGGGGEWTAGVSRLSSDGIYAFNNGYRNTTATARLETTPAVATTAVLTARYTDAKAEVPTDFAGVVADSNQFGTEERLALGLDLSRTLGPQLDARMLLAGSFATLGAENRPDSPGEATGFGYASHRSSHASRRSVDARLNYRVHPGVMLSGGAQIEYERERQDAWSTSDFGDGPATDGSEFEADRKTVGVYLQSVLDLPSGLAVNAGARVDDNDAFGTYVTARLGAAWALDWGSRFRATVGTAFKAPTFSELFAQSAFEVGNPSLSPERSTSWEIGWEQRFLRDRVEVGVAWFDQRFRNLIQFQFIAPGDPTYANLGRASAQGLEVTASGTILQNVQLTAGYTWLRTKVRDAGASTSVGFAEGASLLRRPGHSASATATYRPAAVGSLFAQIGVTGARDDVDFRPFPSVRVRLPRYTILNAGGDLMIPGVAARAALRIENLLDASYETVVGFPARGRTLVVGVSTQF